MAKEQNPGPIEHLIHVEYDAASSTLTLMQTQVPIRPGDVVVWEFFGLPTGWMPWIDFQPDAGFLGPFTDLTQSSTAVWGTCRDDQPSIPAAFAYRASIVKGRETAWGSGSATVRSGAGSVIVGPAGLGTAHRFTVTQLDKALAVSPLGVIIQAGDTVEWVFEGIAQNAEAWRPLVEFHRYDGSGDITEPYLGPFTGLTTEINRVRGMGNNLVAGTYYFQVSLVRVSDGAVLWMSSPDPAVDNRGTVVDPTGG